jgi:hypothetical protein
MATGNVIVTVVDVGQGQSTFVEIYDDATPAKLKHALLFDCGSDKPSPQTPTNLNYIAAKALLLDEPGFDCIFFSHSDKDHISLTRAVLDKIKETKKPVIKEVIFGGAYSKYTKYGFNILEHIEEEGYCATDKICTLASNFTNYNYAIGKKKFEGNLWESTDGSIIVYTIVGNVLSSNPDWDDSDLDVEGANAEALNRVSVIAGLYIKGPGNTYTSYVICGDATNITMAAVNSLFEGGTTVFNKNMMTTMPHHGSRATGLAVKSGKDASDISAKTVDDFAKNLKSFTLSISAYEKHHHPSLELINHFIPTITTPIIRDARLVQKNTHRITAYVDIDISTGTAIFIFRGLSYSFESETNSFSTRYSNLGFNFSYNLGTAQAKASTGVVVTVPLTVINEFACWQYTTKADGTTTFGGYPNLATPLAIFTSAPLVGLLAKQLNEPLITAQMTEQFLEHIEVPVSTFRIKQKSQAVKTQAVTSSSIQNKLKHFY